jgi:hypothetical protein
VEILCVGQKRRKKLVQWRRWNVLRELFLKANVLRGKPLELLITNAHSHGPPATASLDLLKKTLFNCRFVISLKLWREETFFSLWAPLPKRLRCNSNNFPMRLIMLSSESLSQVFVEMKLCQSVKFFINWLARFRNHWRVNRGSIIKVHLHDK